MRFKIAIHDGTYLWRWSLEAIVELEGGGGSEGGEAHWWGKVVIIVMMLHDI